MNWDIKWCFSLTRLSQLPKCNLSCYYPCPAPASGLGFSLCMYPLFGQPPSLSSPCPSCKFLQVIPESPSAYHTIHTLTFLHALLDGMCIGFSYSGDQILRGKTRSFRLSQLSSMKQVLAWDWVGTWKIRRGAAENHNPIGFMLTS